MTDTTGAPPDSRREVEEIYGAVREAQAGGRSPDFTPAQLAALQQMAEVWMGFQTMGKVATWLQRVLKYIAWAVGAFLLYRGWSAGWLRGP